jgi:hypothetical protein
MSAISDDLLEQVDQLLSRPNQVWLLGAGISKDAGLPLMVALTARVFEMSEAKPHKKVLESLRAELPANTHIEHLLSHLGDYTTLAQRNATKQVSINGDVYDVAALEHAHKLIASDIAFTIRWGYKTEDGAEPQAGSSENPIVSAEQHQRFVHALFGKRQAGISDRRKPVPLFTTNYDTLLEDALALGQYTYWDGFSGGAVAFRTHRYGQREPESGCRAAVIKLHGSIDWFLGEDGNVWRVRDVDLYPARTGRVLIYPQATKYIATQRDPFASQFSLFREALANSGENILAVCGYSFGDEHVNQEIELALSSPENKTTLVAFCCEYGSFPQILDTWRKSAWGKRVYVLTERGLYAGNQGPLCEPAAGERDWWTFAGMTAFLESGHEEIA